MKTKRLLGIALAFMLVLASMSTVFAASNADVLKAIAEGVTLKTGDSYYVSTQDLVTAKNYLAEKNLSSDELETIVTCINGVKEVAKNCKDFAELKDRQVAITAVNTAAAVAGVNVALDAGKVVVTDSKGQVLVSVSKDSVLTEKPQYISSGGNTGDSGSTQTSTDAIKQTGADINLTNMMMVIFSTVVVLAGAGFAAFKFNLLKD